MHAPCRHTLAIAPATGGSPTSPVTRLVLQTLRTAVFGLLVLGACLFLPAGTLHYWQAWVFIVVFAISTNIIGLYLALRDPVLLERRKHVGPNAEQNPVQKVFAWITIFCCLGLLVFCGFDRRFGWSPVPPWVSVVGNVLIVLGLAITFVVLRQNPFSGSTVERFEGQRVVSTGLYGAVRHPMYVGALVMMVGLPLALDSWWGLAVFVVMLPALVVRILDEERLLRAQLSGYDEYTRRVRYRLVPGLW